MAALGLVAASLAWAALAPLAEQVRAGGDVETTVSLQRVQHLEGGIVAELLVEDGQKVRADEPILRLQRRALLVEREQLILRAQALALELKRLDALLSGELPAFGSVRGATAAMIDAQAALFEGQRNAERSRHSVLESEITLGADIARIAPDGVSMRIRARISPGDVGMVAPGSEVRLRFPAFDLAQLPPLAGRVETILPGTAPDDAGRAHYTAFISLDDTALLNAAGVRLLPGMAA